MSSKTPTPTPYLKYLESLLGLSTPLGTPVLQHPHCLHLCNMTKLTLSLLTKSLWLTINFHYPNQQFYDPFVSEFVKGGCGIAILAGCGEEVSRLLENGVSLRYDNKEIQSSNKNEGFYESRILARGHLPKLSGIDSVLGLRVEDSRIIEDATNLHISTNQILRWIAERHFENTHRVKISQSMGDEIEYNIQKQTEKTCLLF